MLSAVVAFALAGSIVGCTPQSTPSPAPSSSSSTLSSDAEAFAAAEATIRRYIDASNAVQLNDNASIEAFLALSTGTQHSFDQDRLENYRSKGYIVSGATRVIRVERDAVNTADEVVTLGICLDVSAVEVRDSSGNSVIAPDRPDLQNLVAVMAGEPMQVSSIEGSTEVDSCLG